MSTAAAATQSTREFIEENPVDVQFVRSPRVTTTAGGKVDGAPVMLGPQRVRLVAQSGYVVDSRLNGEGDVAVPRFVVVGMPTIDMKKGDTFTHNDETFRINRVNDSPPWAKRGEAIEHG